VLVSLNLKNMKGSSVYAVGILLFTDFVFSAYFIYTLRAQVAQ
jgi:hypothetical protein